MKALITGASSGIGRDIARILASKKYNLIIVARNEKSLEKLADELKEKNNIIINEINNIKSEDKKIFMMYYYYSKSMREISKELNIKEEKVKSRLHRIRKKIKKILEKRGYSYNG